MLIQFDWVAASFIGFTTLIDLLFRYFVFGRLESIALDIAFFASAFTFTEFFATLVAFRHSASQDSNGVHSDLVQWAFRSGVSILTLVVLAFVHVVLDKRLKSRVEAVFKQQEGKLRSAHDREVIISAKTSMERSVLLTFVGYEWSETLRLREGKSNWRAEVAEFLNALGKPAGRSGSPAVESRVPVKADDLLLPRRTRIVGFILFAVLGTIALAAPFLNISGLLGLG